MAETGFPEAFGANGGVNISRERARQLEEKIIKRLRDFMKKEVKDFEALKP